MLGDGFVTSEACHGLSCNLERGLRSYPLPRIGDHLRSVGNLHACKSKSVGELETDRTAPFNSGRHYKHRAEKAPKEADRYRDDYQIQKKRVQEAKEKRIGKFKDGGAKSELKGVDDVRKQRQLKERRRDKNARPSKKRRL